MSIDIYKEINKELVAKVQELKKANAFLEKEQSYLSAQFFEEKQRRLEERKKFVSILNQLKENINDLEGYFWEEASLPGSRDNSVHRRTRQSGVTTRSPIKSACSEPNDDEANSNGRAWGFENIEEANVESTANALNRLTIQEETSQAAHENDSINRESQTVCNIVVKDASSSAASIESALDGVCCSDGLVNEERLCNVDNISRPSTSISCLTIRDFSLNAEHSTPSNQKSNAITSSSSVTMATTILTESNMDNTNTSTSTRPRRHCAPLSMAEPKLGSKLRNDGPTVKSKKGRKKRK